MSFPYVSQHWPPDTAAHLTDPAARHAFQHHWSDRSCGLACVAMVLRHRRGTSPPLDHLLADALADHAWCDRGWIHAGLARLLQRHAIDASAVPARPPEVIEALRTQALFIASVTLGLPTKGSDKGGHLVLLHGIGTEEAEPCIDLADPSPTGQTLRRVPAARLFHSYAGRGILVMGVQGVPSERHLVVDAQQTNCRRPHKYQPARVD